MELHITSFEELKDAIERYIKYYNEKRINKGKTWVGVRLSIGSTPWLHKNSVAVVKTTTL